MLAPGEYLLNPVPMEPTTTSLDESSNATTAVVARTAVVAPIKKPEERPSFLLILLRALARFTLDPTAERRPGTEAPVMSHQTTAIEPIRNIDRPQLLSSPMLSPNRGESIEILLVEDDAGDAKRTTDALRDGRLRNRITHVEDGVEAMAYLRREGEYANAPRPDLILLDLHMPRMNGQEVLAEIKEDPELRRIPVVMMTASSQEKDIMAAYNLHVNCYVTKPVDLEQFLAAVKSIEHFWINIVKLPAA